MKRLPFQVAPKHAVRLLAAAFLLAFAVLPARAEDWPQFLGPRRDGSYLGPLAKEFPADGPKQSWQISVGNGFAGPVVANGKLFLFHRPGDVETLDCLDPETGKVTWTYSYPATYRDDFSFDPGPRAVPTVAGKTVFTYGPDGVISAVSIDTGKALWTVDARAKYESKKGFFGRSCSPLVYGDLLLLNIGGEGAGIIALDVPTGQLRWKASDDEASYSSPIIATFDGVTNALFLTRHQFLGLDPLSGAIRFQSPFKPEISASVTAATPLVAGDLVFISASYGAGGTAFRMTKGKPVQLWTRDDVLSNHYATSVQRNGLLFGFDGRQEQKPALSCVDWKTGKQLWRKDRFGAGSILIAGDLLVVLLDTGELILAEASGAAYKEISRAQILGAGTRAYPALADGFLYARSKDKLVRLDLR